MVSGFVPHKVARDPKISLKWYEEVLGMTVINESPGNDFTNYFLTCVYSKVPTKRHIVIVFTDLRPGETKEEAKANQMSRQGVLELCHNYGTETDENFKGVSDQAVFDNLASTVFQGYCSGNEADHKGFGHIVSLARRFSVFSSPAGYCSEGCTSKLRQIRKDGRHFSETVSVLQPLPICCRSPYVLPCPRLVLLMPPLAALRTVA